MSSSPPASGNDGGWGSSGGDGWGSSGGDSGGGGGGGWGNSSGGGGGGGWGSGNEGGGSRGFGRGRGRGRGGFGGGREGGDRGSGGWGSSGGGGGGGWGSGSKEDGGGGSGWGSGPKEDEGSSGWGGGGGWDVAPKRDRGGGGGGWGSGPKEDRGGGGWGGAPKEDGGGWGGSRGDRGGRGGGWGNSRGGCGRGGRGGGGGGGDSWGSRGDSGGDSWSKGGSDDNKPTGGDSWSKGDGGGNDDWGKGGNDNGWSKGESKPGGWNDEKTDSGPRKRFKREGDQEGGGWQGDNADEAERPAPYKPEELNLDEEAALRCEGAVENFQRYKEQKVTCLPPDVVTPIDKFEDLITSELLLQNIKSQKYSEMTPIQKWAIPAIMEGKDIIGCAQTGSGKTAAFLLPVLQTLFKTDIESNDPNSDCQNPYCLIIAPTRELANQTYINATMLSKDSIIKSVVIYGQIATSHLKAKLSLGCHILVATPGKLKDFVQRGWIGFKNIKYIVLDEGDRLVDEGFSTDIKSLFSHPTMPPKEDRQTLFFSATFRAETQLNAKEYLKDDFIFLTVGRVGAANEDIKQEFLQVARQEKKRELKKILETIPETDKTIVFTQTKTIADLLAGFFTALNLSATSIHGDRHQSQREQAIKAFRRGEKRFLVSSPVGNRGLDLPKVAIVINYDLPKEVDEYVHRIGRTGRAGHTGRAISFYDEERDSEILPGLIEILKEAKQEIPDWMLGTSQSNDNGGDWGTSDAQDDNPDKDWGSVKPSAAATDSDWGATVENEPKEMPEQKEETAKNEVDGWN